MSLARNNSVPPAGDRDVNADYVAAYVAEYESYARNGETDRAANIAAILKRDFDHDVRPARPAAGAKERAVSEPSLETAVPSDETPKRRPGRPPAKKTEE